MGTRKRRQVAGLAALVGSTGDSFDKAPGRGHPRGVQDPAHLSPSAVDRPGRRRVRHARVDRLVQTPAHPRTTDDISPVEAEAAYHAANPTPTHRMN